MPPFDFLTDNIIIAESGENQCIHLLLGKAEGIFIGFIGQAVSRSLIDKLIRQPQSPAHFFYFRNRQICQWGEISRCITKDC